ncbi:MAG: cupin domain-containing protein [Clostridiales bacterium]|nr:cupin domain-containing protein [Clostridiales bacterium]MDY4172371.1 cupin domain-containing protein [Evtepia sp.]
MEIVFDKIPVEAVPHMRDGQGAVSLQKASDGKVKVMKGILPAGATIGLHTHDTSSEVIYILAGAGKVLCDGVYEPLAPGACHYCPKGHAHSLINDSDQDLAFFAVVPEQ